MAIAVDRTLHAFVTLTLLAYFLAVQLLFAQVKVYLLVQILIPNFPFIWLENLETTWPMWGDILLCRSCKWDARLIRANMQSVNVFSERVLLTWAVNHFSNKQVLFTRILRLSSHLYISLLTWRKKGIETAVTLIWNLILFTFHYTMQQSLKNG